MRRLSILLFALFCCSCAATYFCRYPPSRWLKDSDREPINFKDLKRQTVDIDTSGTGLIAQMNTLIKFSEQVSNITTAPTRGHKEALNVNNFDEVADSTWFTNRIGRYGTASDIKYSFEFKKPFTIIEWHIATLSQTMMVVKDATGRHFVIEMDPAGRPGSITGAEIIAARILNEAGYNTLSSRLIDLMLTDLSLSEYVTYTNKEGSSQTLTNEDLHAVFASGSRRSLIYELPSDKILGPFAFKGKQSHDTNDRIPHEDRRELRAFKVFASLLNLAGAGESNAVDFFRQTTDDNGYVEHYLMNFATAFDNAKTATTDSPDKKNSMRTMGVLFSFGLYDPYWTKKVSSEQTGETFDAGNFNPGKWEPRHSNNAFKELTWRDAFWAAKIIVRFSDADIARIVDAAGYTDTAYKAKLVLTLAERRDKICKYWFAKINPIDNFQLTHDADTYRITFDDLEVKAGIASASAMKYRSILRKTDGTLELTAWREEDRPVATLLQSELNQLEASETYTLQIQSKRAADKWWSPSVDVFVKNNSNSLEMIGIKRRYTH